MLEFSNLTLLVGPNGSGKSNVLDALRFLQGAAFDYPLGDVLRGRWEGQRQVWPGIRGGPFEATRAGGGSFSLRTRWTIANRTLIHKMEVKTEGEVALEREFLHEDSEGDYLFDTHAPSLGAQGGRTEGGGIRLALKGEKGGRSPVQTHSSLRSLLGQVELKARVQERVKTAADLVRLAFREAVFLDIRPQLMRDYRPENGGQLGVSGENISPVLKGLEEDVRAEIIDWLSELCAPDVVGIEFDTTALREVMMMIVEGGGRRVSARSASDGTLRFLGELVALLIAPPGALIVLEEPDVGLHPSRIRLLAELLERVADDHHVQVLATTHSPTLLAHLSKRALGNVIAFGRDEKGATVCQRLKDLPHFATLADSRNVEHLISTGWLERAL
ncbi:MAG: ATP-binding protein [Myxococcales bacterium]|nr:ATP-binding protein [Myxococcales bacterium]